MRLPFKQRTSFPTYDKPTVLTMLNALGKYRGWYPPADCETIEFLHRYSQLVKDGNDEVLDPYPSKNMSNLQALVDALGKFLKSLVRIMRG